MSPDPHHCTPAWVTARLHLQKKRLNETTLTYLSLLFLSNLPMFHWLKQTSNGLQASRGQVGSLGQTVRKHQNLSSSKPGIKGGQRGHLSCLAVPGTLYPCGQFPWPLGSNKTFLPSCWRVGVRRPMKRAGHFATTQTS